MSDDCDNDEILGLYSIEESLAEYRDLIAPDWCRSFANALEQCPPIKEAGNDLMVQWRVATRVADFPATMMVIFSEFAEGDFQRQPPAYMLPMLADAFAASVASHAPPFARGPLFRKAMREALEETQRKVANAIQSALGTMSPGHIWNEYVPVPEFRFRVWGTMQVCSGAIYNAYDGFLRRCAPKTKKRDYLEDRLKNLFGAPMRDTLLNHREIQIARELRHAISHNRGRMTDDLENLRPGIVCHDGLLSVYPRDLRRFLVTMGGAAMKLAQSLAGSG